MHSATYNLFPIKNVQIYFLLVLHVEGSYLNAFPSLLFIHQIRFFVCGITSWVL